MKMSPLIERVHFPPISEVKRWVAARPDDGQSLVDLCQAVPDYAPAPQMTAYLSEMLKDPLVSKYSPDEGLLEVRESLCRYYAAKYNAQLAPENICLTIGASQAFWLAVTTLCKAGDEIIIQSPCYFDHPMALEMLGITCVYAPFTESDAGCPDAGVIETLVTERTRAVLIVTPSNPTGVITAPEVIREMFDVVKRHDIALILDETYNEFIPGGVVPHHLFTLPEWYRHFVHIASFGKTYALTGFRAGMLVAGADFIFHALKAQDSMAVCQPRITQHAIRYGVENLGDWVADNREMMARRHDLFRRLFVCSENPFKLVASGGFFAWVRHPFTGCSGRQAAKKLVDEAAVICLPGEVFGSGLEGYLRLAFGNISENAIPEAVQRFCRFSS